MANYNISVVFVVLLPSWYVADSTVCVGPPVSYSDLADPCYTRCEGHGCCDCRDMTIEVGRATPIATLAVTAADHSFNIGHYSGQQTVRRSIRPLSASSTSSGRRASC